MNHPVSLALLLLLTLQAVAIAACLWAPGSLILRFLLRDGWRELPAFRKLGYSLPLSVLVLAASQSLIFWLSPALVRTLNGILFIGCLAVAAFELRRSRGRIIPTSYLPLVVILLPLLLAIFWLALKTDIPGPVQVGYGDLPAYYRVIDNLARGSFPLIDFRIGELIGEKYTLPTAYPILTLATAFLKTIFTGHRHLLAVLCILIGFAGLLFCGGYLHHRSRPRDERSAQLAVLSLGLLPLILYENALEFVLGAITLPLLTFGLILWDLVWSPSRLPLAKRATLIAASAVAMALSRPGGLLVVALLAGLGLLWALYRLYVTGSRPKKLVAISGALGLLTLGIFGPYERVLGKSPSLFYLHYQEATDDFRYHRIPSTAWWHVMHDNARENFGLERRETSVNSELWTQAIDHPKAFVSWLWTTINERVGMGSMLIFTLATAALLARRSPPTVILALMGWAYLFILAAINPAFFPRHTLPIRTLLFVVAFGNLRPAIQARLTAPLGGRLASVSPLVVLAVPMIFLGLVQGLELRRQEVASPYASIIQTLKPVTDPSSLVATSYPSLMSYSLGAPAVGNALLFELLEPLVARHEPEFIVFDDTRGDLPTGYEEARDLVAAGRAAELGYRLFVDATAERFLILQRQPEQAVPPLFCHP